jgi:hypothetical protein
MKTPITNNQVPNNKQIPNSKNGRWALNIGNYLVIGIWSLVIAAMLSGCAKVVTPVFTAGKHITMEINYKANIDTTANKYYIIFNNNSSPLLPFMPVQFVEPGETPAQPDVDYYGQYYPTWKSYVVLDGNSFSFVKGPFTSEAVPTKEVIATWSGAQSNQISITFDMSRLGTLTERLNFDIVSVDKTSKLVKDNLSPLNSSPSTSYVFTITDTTATGSDEATPGIPESVDILNWRILVQ